MKQDNSRKPRTSGILLHPSSLPNTPVCGTFGAPARDWVRLLSDNGIGVWQFLPLAPTDSFGSPYSSPSSFSFNPCFIDVHDLVEDGFLPHSIIRTLPGAEDTNCKVDFSLADLRSRKIGQHLRDHWQSQSLKRHDQFRFWCEKQFWLKDHAIYMQIRRENKELPWWEWQSTNSQNAYEKDDFFANEKLLEHCLLQWHLDRQWNVLKNLAEELGVILFGDLPFYVSADSADVWSNKSLFSTFENGTLNLQSGVPPDYFSETGQLWGTPVYRWKKHKSTRYKWWRNRVKRHLNQVNLLRVDHFRALASYWAVPGHHETAQKGYWLSSPGLKILRLLEKDYGGKLPLIAEDLGVITKEVESLRDYFDLPGMKILQFAFDGNLDNPYLPENIKGNNWIVYTGTHDNSTTYSWLEEINSEIKSRILERVNGHDSSLCWKVIEMGLSTEARLFVAPLQDLLCLDNNSRLNKPGSIENNWSWRLRAFDLEIENAIAKFGQKSSFFNRSSSDALKLI